MSNTTTDCYCSHCHHDLDVCACCERDECPMPLCFRCLRERVLPQAPDLHTGD